MPKRSYSDEVMTSEQAYKILSTIAKEQPITPTEIANKVGTSPKTVSNYLKGLREREFVYVSKKEGRKKLYKYDKNSLYDYHHKKWKALREEFKEQKSVEDSAHDKELFTLVYDNIPLSEEQEKKIAEEEGDTFEKNKKIGEFVKRYIELHLRDIEQSDIESMIVDNFANSFHNLLLFREQEGMEIADWADTYYYLIIDAIIHYTDAIELHKISNTAYVDVEDLDGQEYVE